MTDEQSLLQSAGLIRVNADPRQVAEAGVDAVEGAALGQELLDDATRPGYSFDGRAACLTRLVVYDDPTERVQGERASVDLKHGVSPGSGRRRSPGPERGRAAEYQRMTAESVVRRSTVSARCRSSRLLECASSGVRGDSLGNRGAGCRR